MKEKIVAIKAAKEAGKILMKSFCKQHTIKAKGRHERVTEMDTLAEKKIFSIIKKSFPDYNILSEEAGKIKKHSDYLWVIDPLDGTTNYSINNPFFDVSIALVKNNEVILGVVWAPVTKELFVAEKGKGALLNNKRIHVSEEKHLSKSLLVYCHGNEKKEIKKVTQIFKKIKPLAHDFTRMRAGALELAFVAAGRLEAYVSNGGKPWDAAAGALLVREAGGKVTDFKNKKWNIRSKNILASNKKIHKKILKLINY